MLFPTFFQIINLLNFVSAVHSQSTCGPKVSARLLMDIPCDMSQTNFCEMSGIAYPWAAVRRYIFENQGLLRRMYGDQRHYQILTNEIQDLKDRYDNILMQDKIKLSASKRKPQFRPRSIFLEDYSDSLDGEESEQDKSSPNSSDPSGNRTSTSAKSEKPQNQREDLSYDHALPLDESTTTNHWLSTGNDMATESTITEKEEESTVITTTIKANDETSPQSIRNSDKNQNDNEENSKSSSLPPAINVTQTQSSSSVIFPKNDMPINESSSETSVTPLPNRISFSPEHEPTSDGNTTSQPQAITSPIMTPQVTQAATTSLPTVTEKAPSPPTIKEEVPQEELPKKGVNACPVREEVIAPYWANNTRGEVLALLNVYPFEQYVHWEKCAYEKMQMFCREGCRCEQQYRLHRLLAFDPKNECRGIFADWFRFPSCCVCICYDLPESSILHRVGSHRKGRL
ncbi:protein spaetzle 4-like [Brevipalpus obovatus]|uniref:protein spaetzle 4-like n=1 Tax=Brevipalpus obovatus TaxID=246614 RepID=UPI003D9F2481